MMSKTKNPLYTLTNTQLFVVFVFGVIAIYWAHHGVVEHHTNNLRLKASESLGIYQNNLNNELTRFSFLPYVVARDEQLINWSFNEPSKANKAPVFFNLPSFRAKDLSISSVDVRLDNFIGLPYK